MSDGTRSASPRRREQARRLGDVAFSPALTRGVAWVAALSALLATAPRAFDHLLAFARGAFTPGFAPAAAPPADLAPDLALVAAEAFRAAAWLFLPAALAAFSCALLVGLLQTRALFTAAPLAPALPPTRPRRRDAEGWLRASAFALVAAAAIVIAMRRESYDFLRTTTGAPLLSAIAAFAGRVALRAGLVLLAFGLADFGFRWLRRERALRPTPAQARSEAREDAIDPRLRAEHSRRARDPR